jgi:AraC family transcriptional regulator
LGVLLTKLTGDTEMFLWDGGCAFVGNSSARTAVHSHQAIQLVYGTDAEVQLGYSLDGPWVSGRLLLVTSHQLHIMDATAVTLGVTMFIEPETIEGRALAAISSPEGITSLDPSYVADPLAALFEKFLTRRGDAEISAAARRVVTTLTNGVEPKQVTHERIVRALAWLNDHIKEQVTLDQVAAAVFLSPSRFRHLFVEEMGMGLRPWLLWRRFMRTWGMIMEGATISRAAHEAGFADAAHFTRTSNRMIGVAPSGFRVSHSPAALTEAQSRAAKP